MADVVDPPSKIDQAALLGAALAAAVGISAADGPWELMESAIGVVLLLVIRSFYDVDAARSRPDWRRVKYAVAGVRALVWCLVFAFLVQFVLAQLGYVEDKDESWLHYWLTGVTALAFIWELTALTTRWPSRLRAWGRRTVLRRLPPGR